MSHIKALFSLYLDYTSSHSDKPPNSHSKIVPGHCSKVIGVLLNILMLNKWNFPNFPQGIVVRNLETAKDAGKKNCDPKDSMNQEC